MGVHLLIEAFGPLSFHVKQLTEGNGQMEINIGKIDIKKEDDKFFWRQNDYYEEGDWEQIPKRLYLALKAYKKTM